MVKGSPSAGGTSARLAVCQSGVDGLLGACARGRLMSFIKVSMAVMALAAVLAGNATARDDGRYSGSPLKPWFDTLRSAKGLCCSVPDGFVVPAPHSEPTDGTFRARLH